MVFSPSGMERESLQEESLMSRVSSPTASRAWVSMVSAGRLPLVVPGALGKQGQEPEDVHLPDQWVVRLLHSVRGQPTQQGLADVHGVEDPDP